MMLSLPQLIPSKIGHILEVSVTKKLIICSIVRAGYELWAVLR